MASLDLSRVVNNPRLQQPFQIERNVYSLQNEGEWALVSTTTINAVAVITPADPDDQVKYLPEGQRQTNAIALYSPVEIRMADGNTKESDVILWNGAYYRVQFSKPWHPYGYWFAIATGFVHGS